jgi:hypothetical protein
MTWLAAMALDRRIGFAFKSALPEKGCLMDQGEAHTFKYVIGFMLLFPLVVMGTA